MDILINGDYHEFHFSGLAKDVLDSAELSTDRARRSTSFPAEPADLVHSITRSFRGNMGQAWLGAEPVAVLHDHERDAITVEERSGRTEQGIRVESCVAMRSRRDSGR